MAKTPEETLRKELHGLTNYIKDYLALVDDAMRQPESAERGKRIAHLSNALNMKNDMIRRFVLDLNFNGRRMNPTHTKRASR